MNGHAAVQQFARERRTIACGDRKIEVLCSRPIVRDQDSGVLLMHEAFGVTESVLRLAGLIAAAGFVVWVPVLFGPSDKPATPLTGGAGCLYAWCVRREIYAFAAHRTSPVTDLIRAACRKLADDTGRPVGVVGLCLTGNFALATTTESMVNAVVCGQPSLPMPPILGNRRALHLGKREVEALKNRTSAGLDIFITRFDQDRISPKQRIDQLRDLVGPERVIQPEIPGRGHATLTKHLSPFPNHPTQRALRKMIEYLERRLTLPARFK